MNSDKEQERQRDNDRALNLLDNGAEIPSRSIPLLLQSPYTFTTPLLKLMSNGSIKC